MRQAYSGCGRGGWQHRDWHRHAAMFRRQPPVNITENPDAFIIELFAPGMSKEMFKITTQDDVLSIRYTPGSETAEHYRHQEYRLREFERSFDLKGKVNLDDISAKYDEGILKIRLSKTAAAKRPAQDIRIDA